MKRLLLCAFLACTLTAASASAGTFKLPDADSGFASVEIPDAWKPNAIEKGVQANSPDDEVYVAFEGIATDKGVDESLAETKELLQKNNVVLDPASEKKSTFKLGDAEAVAHNFKAKMGDVEQSVSIVLIPLKDKVVLMTYWGNVANAQAHVEEIGKMALSVKAL